MTTQFPVPLPAGSDLAEPRSPTRDIWVIDGAYLMKASPGHFDYMKLKLLLEEQLGNRFSESYYVNSSPRQPGEGQDSFHNWLKMAPPQGPGLHVLLYGIKEQQINCPLCHSSFERPVQKGVDVAIATLIIRLAVKNRCERLLLTAGDGDLTEAVAFVRDELDREIFLAGFASSLSPDLQPFATQVIWLDQHWQRIARADPREHVPQP